MEQVPQITQLISGDGKYLTDVQLSLRKWGFHESGGDYKVVSILGAQSSGKSTLLNLVFGTNFSVMNESLGRNQTTRGIWLGKCGVGPTPVVVLDVEGTDGRERGEDEKTFERQTSLFSLALAQILVVNMWTTDVGRYEAANFGLLKTVFEQNLRLFGKSRRSAKTRLFFVLRDYSGRIPFDKLTRSLADDLDKIWEQLVIPPELGGVTVSDFFTLDFVGMPHKEFQEADFATAAQTLRERFTDPGRDDYLLPATHEDVPADGWAQYAENIWHTIVENKDLDLPSQKVFLATMRCDELSAKCLADFLEQVRPLRARLEKAASPYAADFADVLLASHRAAMANYDAVTERYFRDVVQAKRKELHQRLVAEAYGLFLLQVTKVSAAAVHQFNAAVDAAFAQFSATNASASAETSGAPFFGGQVQEAKQKSVEFFQETLQACMLPDSAWLLVEAEDALRLALDERMLEVKREQMEQLRKLQEKTVAKALVVPLRGLLEAPNADSLWKDVRAVYESVRGDTRTALEARLALFGASADERAAELAALDQSLVALVVSAVKQHTDNIQSSLRREFDRHFAVDASGVPRDWEHVSNIAALYEEALGKATRLLDALALVRLDAALDAKAPSDADWEDSDVDSAVLLLPRATLRAAQERFVADSRIALANAQAERKRIGSPQMFSALSLLLIAVLGFDEFLMVIQNPLMLIIVALVGALGFVLHRMGMLFPILDTVLRQISLLGSSNKQKVD